MLAIALTASALAHFALLAAWAAWTRAGSPHHAPTARRTAAGSTAMRVVTLAPSPATTPSDEVTRPKPEPRSPASVKTLFPKPERPGSTTAGRPSPTERLRPAMGDARLWVAPPAPRPARRPADAAEAHAFNSMQEIADSARTAEEEERRVLDWSFTDDHGRRWGFSPTGQLYLGGLLGSNHPTIEFAGKPEAERRAREWHAIQDQAALFRVRQVTDERRKAVRARVAQQRDSTPDEGPLNPLGAS